MAFSARLLTTPARSRKRKFGFDLDLNVAFQPTRCDALFILLDKI
jgi:hypothetical protein